MGLWTWLCGADAFGSDDSLPTINPATGLPMISDSTAGVDVGGHFFGEGDLDGLHGMGALCGLGDIGGSVDPCGGTGGIGIGSGFGE